MLFCYKQAAPTELIGNMFFQKTKVLLDFCFDEQMLTLYRKLCRHLYSFDPETAVEYVAAYRERWDEEGKQFGTDKKEVI